ncbi:MAG: hypothetical protein ACLP4V_25975, partial [Methylocella sp.]
AGLWKCGQGKRLDHSPTGEQKQKKRTFDVLPKPAKLISYRQLSRHLGNIGGGALCALDNLRDFNWFRSPFLLGNMA